MMPYVEEDLTDERTEFAFSRPIFNVRAFWQGAFDERRCSNALGALYGVGVMPADRSSRGDPGALSEGSHQDAVGCCGTSPSVLSVPSVFPLSVLGTEPLIKRGVVRSSRADSGGRGRDLGLSYGGLNVLRDLGCVFGSH